MYTYIYTPHHHTYWRQRGFHLRIRPVIVDNPAVALPIYQQAHADDLNAPSAHTTEHTAASTPTSNHQLACPAA